MRPCDRRSDERVPGWQSIRHDWAMKRAKSLPESQSSARRLRRKLTPSEKVIWRFVSRKRMGVHFRRQEPVGPYVADFLSYEASLVVEADGTQHDEGDADEIRDAYLAAAGFRVIRLMNRFIALEPEAVEDMIRVAVQEQLAHLPPDTGIVSSPRAAGPSGGKGPDAAGVG